MAQILQFTPQPLAKIGFQRVRKRRKPRREKDQLDLFSSGQGQVLQLPRPSGSFDHALLLDERGDEMAGAAYREAIAEGDSVADAYCNLGILESKTGHTATAFDCFTKSLAADPRHLESHYNLGNLYFEAGDYKLARTHFEIAAEIDPNFRNVHFNLGLINAMENQFRSAVSCFERYVSLAPEKEAEKAQALLANLRQSLQSARS